MATTRYTQNVAIEQIPFGNFPGGGPIPGPNGPYGAFPAQFNDPALEIGDVHQVTAIYQMYGNEVANDVINVYLAQPGTMVDPANSTVTTTGIATTATLDIGDDDTNGYGLISSGVAFGTNPSTVTPQGADISRYASGINVATGQTNPVAFGASGSSLVDPHVIGGVQGLGTEPTGGSAGTGVSGSWIQARLSTLGTPVAGKCLIFKLKLIKP